MIIDATDLIMGRLAAHVAKLLLEGKRVSIINAESAVITGNRDHILQRYRQRRSRGHIYHGPYFPRMPDRILRRAVRGMLPYKQQRGRDAFHRLKVYIGKPEKLKDIEPEKTSIADISTSATVKYMKLYARSNQVSGTAYIDYDYAAILGNPP